MAFGSDHGKLQVIAQQSKSCKRQALHAEPSPDMSEPSHDMPRHLISKLTKLQGHTRGTLQELHRTSNSKVGQLV
jgi:hypothetical protein